MSSLPFASIIVPVYNDPDGIRQTIKALLEQSYPKDRYEILVVDNNSVDTTAEVIKSFPVIYLEEKNIQSSYAARNQAIQIARGDIFAFTDSGCIPERNWLKNGIESMQDKTVALGVGKITFFSHNDRMNVYEIYDSSAFLQQHLYVECNFGATANVFARKDDIERVGRFRDDLISGGDKDLGQRLSKIGTVKYLDNAIVKHPTRATFEEMLKKTKRIYTGVGQFWALGLPGNTTKLSFWRPRIRVWRQCEFWSTLAFIDKIKYWFIVNIFIYIGAFTAIGFYRRYKKQYST